MSEVIENADDLVKIYLAIRGERSILKEQYESRDNELKADQEKIEAALLALCNASGTTGGKTTSGTFTKQLKERFVCSDWGNFRKFIEDEASIDLLEQRIHQGNFKKFMAERKDEGLPPGVNAMREYTIVVRKPTASSELSQ